MVEDKILALPEVLVAVRAHKAAGRTIVFTNGCFDIIHYGHVKCLEAAKQQGDILIVGLNSDSSVRRLKGPLRPLLPQLDRAATLAGLESVDYVCIFSTLRPNKLIAQIRPDIHVKGGDYRKEDLPEAPIVERYGGKIVIVPTVRGRSTSAIIDEVLRRSSCESSG